MMPRSACFCLPLAALLAGSCVTAPARQPIAPPPEWLLMNEHYRSGRNGYAVRLAYFTAAQLLDPVWEARRLERMSHIGYCRGNNWVLRREVRWYPATPLSRRSCAAIVYSFGCAIPIGADEPSPERERLYLLRDDPDPPIGRDCGEKNGAGRPLTVLPSPADQLAAFLSSEAVCVGRDTTPDDPIRLHSQTRIRFRTLIAPGFAAASRATVPTHVLHTLAPAGLKLVFYRASLVEPRLRASAVENDGVNILVTQTYALDRAGRPYCVELTARQGARIWRRHFAHPGFVEERRAEVGTDRWGRSNDPGRFWSPTIDAVQLGEDLAVYLIPRADPVYRRGRTRRWPA